MDYPTTNSYKFVYVRGENVPFDEDILHELKGHRTICIEESNPRHIEVT